MEMILKGTKREVEAVLANIFEIPKCIFEGIYRCDHQIKCCNCPIIKREVIVWRGKQNEEFFSVDMCGKARRHLEDFSNYTEEFYNAGNYFQRKQDAEKAAEKIRSILTEANR